MPSASWAKKVRRPPSCPSPSAVRAHPASPSPPPLDRARSLRSQAESRTVRAGNCPLPREARRCSAAPPSHPMTPSTHCTALQSPHAEGRGTTSPHSPLHDHAWPAKWRRSDGHPDLHARHWPGYLTYSSTVAMAPSGAAGAAAPQASPRTPPQSTTPAPVQCCMKRRPATSRSHLHGHRYPPSSPWAIGDEAAHEAIAPQMHAYSHHAPRPCVALPAGLMLLCPHLRHTDKSVIRPRLILDGQHAPIGPPTYPRQHDLMVAMARGRWREDVRPRGRGKAMPSTLIIHKRCCRRPKCIASSASSSIGNATPPPHTPIIHHHVTPHILISGKDTDGGGWRGGALGRAVWKLHNGPLVRALWPTRGDRTS